MTVIELISKLQTMPQDLTVCEYIHHGEADYMDIKQVSVENAYLNSTDTIKVVIISD